MRLGLGIGIPQTGGLVQAFSPLDLSPVLWLDASDTSTITESGGAVSQWDNKGSLGNFTQGTAAAQPTTGVTTQNSLNVIDFAADYLTSADAASAYNDLHNGTDYIVAAVVSFGVVADPDAGYVMIGSMTPPTNRGTYVSWDDRSTTGRNEEVRHIVTNGGGVVVSADTASGFFAPQTFGVLSILADPGAAVAADRTEIFLDDGAGTKPNTSTGAASASDAAAALRIGALGDNSSPMTGSIAELIIVTGANATEANRQELRDYLNNKWAVY